MVEGRFKSNMLIPKNSLGWAEVAVAYGHAVEKAVEALTDMGIQFSAMTLEANLEAAKSWHTYLRKGGGRRRIAADFLVGAHALTQSDRLLTRDKRLYRTYFKGLRIESP
jgi:predicted nucleic acid-binding protein